MQHVGQACLPSVLLVLDRVASLTRSTHAICGENRIEKKTLQEVDNYEKNRILYEGPRCMSSPPTALLPAVLGTIDIVSGVGKAKKKTRILVIGYHQPMEVYINTTFREICNYSFLAFSLFPFSLPTILPCYRRCSSPVQGCSLFVVEAIIGPQRSGLGARPTRAEQEQDRKNSEQAGRQENEFLQYSNLVYLGGTDKTRSGIGWIVQSRE